MNRLETGSGGVRRRIAFDLSHCNDWAVSQVDDLWPFKISAEGFSSMARINPLSYEPCDSNAKIEVDAILVAGLSTR